VFAERTNWARRLLSLSGQSRREWDVREGVLVSQVRVRGALADYAVGFGDFLAGRGYAPGSITQQLGLASQLSRWLDAQGLGADGLTQLEAERFLAARRARGVRLFRSRLALEPILGYLRGLGVAPEVVDPGPVGPVELLIERYRRYLLVERTLTSASARLYVRSVRPFVERFERAGRLELERVTSAQVSAFVLDESRRLPGTSIRTIATALRSLLGFLHVEGLVDRSLAGAVPGVGAWRGAGLPRPLESDQLRRLLASFDRGTSVGRRDFAIVVLMARLGLRCGEVSGLALEDIGWRAGELLVYGKGRHDDRLPLPVDVGAAVAAYLRRDRPPSAPVRAVFVTALAPYRAMGSGAVSRVVFRASERAGLGPLTAHRLRHTAATEMLRAGASLPEVGQMLRHRSLLSTAIYAKVDDRALRELARPWPTAGGLS
jgi:integrase/recombinase XerD